jgi:hypothetical protein
LWETGEGHFFLKTDGIQTDQELTRGALVTEQVGLSGACSCGAVKYRSDADLRRVVNCHCNMCRKMNGGAFSSYAVIPRKLLVLSGSDNLAEYQVTAAARKYFCKKCGTPIFNTNEKYPGACMIYLGSLEGGANHEPSINVFSESMLGWVESIGSIARTDQRAS